MKAQDREKQAYDVLRECAGRFEGITAIDFEARCNERYGKRSKDYWTKQLEALAEMGYAQKVGRCKVNGGNGVAVLWATAEPWEE